jgi:ParB family chromosome partitioning protein
MAKKKALGKGLRALIPEGGAAPYREVGARVVDVALDRIRPNPTQPRMTFADEGIAELAVSIKSQGVLQPVTLTRSGDEYHVVIGERRVRAARQAGLRTIPAVIKKDIDNRQMLEFALVENIQREDLPPLELAEAYRLLQDEHGLTQQEIAARVGKSRETVANTMRLLGLPRLVKEHLASGRISAGHAKALLGLSSDRLQLHVAGLVVQRRLSVRQTEDLVRKAERPVRKPRKPVPVSAEISQSLDELQRKYATRVTLARHGGRGRVEIHFYSDEELGRVLELLLS